MNEHDSERIAGLFEQDGMIKANSIDDSDILFVNTCTIRENADDKLYGTLGQLKVWKNNNLNDFYFDGAYIHLKPYLINQSGNYEGYPFRSFAGGNFIGGYSDHLPVYIILKREQ